MYVDAKLRCLMSRKSLCYMKKQMSWSNIKLSKLYFFNFSAIIGMRRVDVSVHIYKRMKSFFFLPSSISPKPSRKKCSHLFIRYAQDKHSFIGYKGQLIIIFQLELYAFLQDTLIRYRQLLAMKLTYITYNGPTHLILFNIKFQAGDLIDFGLFLMSGSGPWPNSPGT